MNDWFVKDIVSQLKRRLLQIGQSTSTILFYYIKLIDVMKLIDPSTLILE